MHQHPAKPVLTGFACIIDVTNKLTGKKMLRCRYWKKTIFFLISPVVKCFSGFPFLAGHVVQCFDGIPLLVRHVV